MASAAVVAWRERVPELVTACRDRWDLRLGRPYAPGFAGHAVRAELPDGTPAVLKLCYPHRESEQEADALERWAGEGAVQLYARDDERCALLLERCEPGTFLSASPDALDVLVDLLPRLWRSGAGFRSVADEAEHWLDGEGSWAVGERARDAARRYLEELVPTQGEQVLVHQDLHGENVLAAEREPWLAIDPKPLAAERELSAAPIVRSFELGHGRRQTFERLDRLCGEIGLDRERALGWTVAQTAAWSGSADPRHLEILDWLLEAA